MFQKPALLAPALVSIQVFVDHREKTTTRESIEQIEDRTSANIIRHTGNNKPTFRDRPRMNCKNCQTKILGNFCAQCGQAVKLPRIDGHFILHEIEHVLHFEKGLFFTIRELLVRPGQSVRGYLSENRSRLVKPIIFLIIASLIYTLIEHLLHIEKGIFKINEEKVVAVNVFSNWVHSHYGYANIMMGMLIAFWLKIFFRKYEVNFFEIAIVLSYVMGMGMLFLSVFALVQGLTQLKLMATSGVISFIYISWAIGQFFDKSKPINFVKAGAAYELDPQSPTGVQQINQV